MTESLERFFSRFLFLAKMTAHSLVNAEVSGQQRCQPASRDAIEQQVQRMSWKATPTSSLSVRLILLCFKLTADTFSGFFSG